VCPVEVPNILPPCENNGVFLTYSQAGRAYSCGGGGGGGGGLGGGGMEVCVP